MKKILFPVLVGISLLFCSCENDAGTEVTEYMPNFIDAYYSYDDCVIYVYDSYQFRICADFEINRDINNWYTLKSKDESNRATFTELSIKNNDTSFNQYVTFVWGYASYNMMPNIDIKAINIVSSVPIDKDHPAGTSLNDLFDFQAVTPRDFINSNYTKVLTTQEVDALTFSTGGLYSNPYFTPCYMPIIKPLESVVEEDLVLIGDGDMDICTLFVLNPKDKFNCPAYGKTLTITLTYDGKEPISKTFTYTKGKY